MSDADMALTRICGLEASIDDQRRMLDHKDAEILALQQRINRLEEGYRKIRDVVLNTMRDGEVT